MDRIPFTFTEGAGERRKKSQKQEKNWAGKVRGKVQPASGAIWSARGDVRERAVNFLANFLWENKRTETNSFRITVKLWEEIEEKAFKLNNVPAMHLEIAPSSLSRPLRLVVLTEDDFLRLRESAENRKEG